MRQTRIARISVKQAARNKKLAAMKPPSDGLCVKCGKKPFFPPIGKHHKVRRSDGGKDNPSNLEYLCQECHGKEYGEKSRDKRKFAPKLYLSGFGHGQAVPKPNEQTGSKKA